MSDTPMTFDPHAAPGDHPSRARLPDATRVGRVRLRVADLERSLGFYRGVLGMHLAASEGGAAHLSAAPGERTIVELHERPGIAPAPRRGALGLFHHAVLVPSRAALGAVLRRLAQAEIPLGASDHAVSEALYMADPDGNGVEVYADRPRETWRRNGPELHMDTAPLDLRALYRDAGPASPDLAQGTVIGHVHLHVGDLAESDAFYRHALGLDLVVWSYPGAAFFSAGGYHHHLGTNTWAAGAPPADEGHAGLIDWELLLPSGVYAEAAAERLRAAGHALEPATDGWRVRDPSGTTLHLAIDS